MSEKIIKLNPPLQRAKRLAMHAVVYVFLLPMLACLQPGRSKTNGQIAADLTLVGSLLNIDGLSIANGSIYLANESDPIGRSDASGRFSVKLSSAKLMQVAQALTSTPKTFQLYASNEDGSWVATSEAIDINWRGQRNLRDIKLNQAASIEGTVLIAGGGKLSAPAADVNIMAGRAVASSTASGNFKLDGLTTGKNSVQLSLPGYATAQVEVDLQAGETQKLPRQIVLFPAQEIAGTMILDESDAAFNADGTRPFLRRLQVMASPEARFVRYHHDLTTIQNSEAIAWQSLTDVIDYDFPHDAANVLYFQFADANRQQASVLYQLPIIIADYWSSSGIIIEDGQGLATSRNITVHADVPANAYRMRLAEDPQALNTAPWQLPTPISSYVLALQPNPSTGLPEATGLRTLYCQFSDIFGLISPVYAAKVQLQTFPLSNTPPFMIEGGMPETNSHLVHLNIQIPPNAIDMRIFEAPGDAGAWVSGSNLLASRYTGDLWLPVTPEFIYTFASAGIKSLYLQFRAFDGSVSPVYQQIIRIMPYPPLGDDGFLINGGALVSPSRNLAIDLLPPMGSIQFKIFDSEDIETLATWRTLVPSLVFTTRGLGLRTIIIKYRNADWEESGAYAHGIIVDE